MSDRPILFSGPMVRAILSGAKTQTRRLVKTVRGNGGIPLVRVVGGPPGVYEYVSYEGKGVAHNPRFAAACSPYGGSGDRLWVRETWGLHAHGDYTHWNRDSIRERTEDDLRGSWNVAFAADATSPYDHWRPSIHMPRWASRITLDVLSVRVERLHDISEEDAQAEGVEPYTPPHGRIDPNQRVPGPGFDGARLGDQPHRLPFADLWRSINGEDSWDANPWVWRIEFKRAEGSR